MADTAQDDLREQLRRAAAGDECSWRRLLSNHHDRLRRMVAVRLDPRLQGRLDPSDVLQEAYLEASRRLGDYLRQPDVPFHLWLRGLAGNRLNKLHRQHLGAQKRDAGRDVSLDEGIPEASSVVLAACLLGKEDRPSEAVARAEVRAHLADALDQLDPLDREALVLRHLEQLSSAEAGRVLGISEAAAGKRYLRALERLRQVLANAPGGLDALRP
jgi:RNA polymerase sigma-70 factor (ECF subfamily)